MTSLVRRAKAKILRMLAGSVPSTVSATAQLYALNLADATQMLIRDGAGQDFQLTPFLGAYRSAFYVIADFLTTNLLSITTSGPATVVYTKSSGGHPGIATQAVTNVGNAARLLATNNNITAIVAGVAPIYWEACSRTPTVQDATDQWSDRYGIGDSSIGADATDGIYFETDRATYGDNNVRLCAASGGTRTKTSMGVAPTANTWERWKLIVNAAASSVQGYLNDVATGSAVTTNIPTSGTASILWSQIVKTAGTNAREVDRDYLEIYQLFTTPR